MSDAPPFSWKREIPFILLAGLLATAVRIPAVRFADATFDSDNSLGPIMAKHIWEDGYRPLMCNGQDYLGAGEAYVNALLVPLFPGDPSGVAISQVLMLVICLFPIYRLCHLVGGRSGAVAASLLLAIGSPWLVRLTTNAAMGYLSNLFLAALLLLVGLRVTERPTGGRLLGLGLLIGVGYWNNPAIMIFAGALILAFWARGALFEARGEGRLREALSTRVGLALKILLGISIVALAVTSYLPWHDEHIAPLGKRKLLGFISLGRPEHYFPRALALLGLTAGLFELYLSRARGLLVKRVAACGTGVALGVLPLVWYHASGAATGVAAWMRYKPDRFFAWMPGFMEGADLMLFGAVDTPNPAYRVLRWGVAALFGIALFALLWRHRGAIGRRLLLKPSKLPPVLMFLMPALLLLLIGVIRGGLKPDRPRYFFPLWLSLVALASWAVGRVARWDRAAAAVGLGVVLAYFAIGQVDYACHWLPEHRLTDEAALIQGLADAGVTEGYGNYWVAFKISYLSDERLLVACDFDPGGNDNRFAEWNDKVGRNPYPVYIFDLAPPPGEVDDRIRAAEFVARCGSAITRRWRFGRDGRFEVFQVRR